MDNDSSQPTNWRLYSAAEPDICLSSGEPPQGKSLQRTALCRAGHQWPVLPSQPSSNILRIIGTVASGKSVLLRPMVNLFTFPVMTPTGGTPRLQVRAHRVNPLVKMASEVYAWGGLIDSTPSGPMPPTAVYANSALVFLNDFLLQRTRDGEAGPDLNGFLKRAGFSDPEIKALGEVRLPAVFVSSVTETGRDGFHTGVTAVQDLPGEIMQYILRGSPSGNDDRDLLELRRSDALAWVVDPVTFPVIREGLLSAIGSSEAADSVIVGVSRHGRDTALADSLRAVEGSHEVSGRVLAVLNMLENPAIGIDDITPVYLTVSKCDIIYYLLCCFSRDKQGPWSFLGSEHEAFIQGAKTALAGIARRIHDDPELRRTIAGSLLADAWLPSGEIDEDQIEAVIESVLEHFGKPENFWSLIVSGHEQNFLVRSQEGGARNLRLESISVYLQNSLDGRLFQTRDLVSTVIAGGMLGVSGLDRTQFQNLNANLPVRYFLGYVRVDGYTLSDLIEGVSMPDKHNYGGAVNACLQHLYFWFQRKAIMP